MKFSYSNWVAELEQQDELTPLEQRFNPWSKRFQWLNDHSEHILSFCAAIFMAISSVISSPTLWAWGLLLVGVLLLAASIITAIRRQELLTQIEKHYHSKVDEISEARSRKSERISVLEETMTKAEQYIESDRQAVLNVLHEATESMARELDLWDTEIRLSLYRHSAVRGEFIRLARVSDNPDLESVGRNAYPDDEGIIAQAWQHGHAFAPDMPKTRGRWIQHQVSQYGLPRSTADHLTMHAIWMLGVRIEYNGEKLGLVIVEGAKKNSLTPTDVDALNSSNLLTTTIPRLLFASQIALRRYLK